MKSKFLSTGQAAKICSVTPDTVLKWIKTGKLPARRTAGGHYRIRRRDLRFFESEQPEQGRVQYCWQFNARGNEPKQECTECVVYRTRAYRCYEVNRLAPDAHARHFCKQSCEACDYYLHVHKQDTNLLVVSDNAGLTRDLEISASTLSLNLEVTDCEYGCSALVETFRPDYVVVDCSLGTERSRDFVFQLKSDPRIPYVRVILAGNDAEQPHECDREVFARIRKPFKLGDIYDCIRGVKEGVLETIAKTG